MGDKNSYFRGLKLKLSLPVLIGAGILYLYYWKLFDLTPHQLKTTILYLIPAVSFFLFWPIPLNRFLLRPVIRYLKGNGTAEEAQRSAVLFPFRSSIMSMASWTIGGVAVVYFSLDILRLPIAYRMYLFMACISAGSASTFIHFHLMREAMAPIRVRISEDTGKDLHQMRYPIQARLQASFTILIGLATIFIALMDNAHIEQSLRLNTKKILQGQVDHWSRLIENDLSLASRLPTEFTIQSRPATEQADSIVAQSQLASGQYLVGRFPASTYQFVLDPVEWEAAGIIVITILIAGIVSYFAAVDISRPLKVIRDKTRSIAQGDFSHTLNVVTDDEVAELAHSINLMADDLRNKLEQIQKARDHAQGKSEQLEEANRELLKLDELKSDFLANISHELKAPLVSTKGYVDFILSGKMGTVNEKQVKGLTVARDNLNHLTRLISSLLDFSKVSTGALKLHHQACNLSELIESCVQTVVPEARRKNKTLEFTTDIPQNLPWVYADPDRIREVLLNLLMNAEKFTESGGKISVSAKHPSPEDEFVSVSVEDNGIGIPQDHLGRIFNRFHQVDGSSTRKYGGTGLGLAIVHEILEAHGCRIYVESNAGSGSRFTFTLPVHRAATTDPVRATAATRASKHHASKLVEVVEDDVNIGSIVKTLLEEEGFAVIQARTAKDAILIAREHRPDLITLDVYLPDMNGFDLLSRLQADPATSQIPVIILSVLMDKEKGFRLGASDYLEKPIDAEKLRSAVDRISKKLDGLQGSMKVMVVDDDASTLQFLSDCLTVEGYSVCTQEGGSGAAALAEREKPDLVLLDLVMPDMEGLEVLKQLKNEATTRQIPVIVLTGKGRLEDRDRSLNLGAEEFLAKPVELQDLVKQVKRYFGTS